MGELFDNLIACGQNCFNPFRPEVMDVDAKAGQIPGTSRFSWGIVHQRTLPFGSPEDVRRVSEHLLNIGAGGGRLPIPSRATPRSQTYWHSSTQLKAGRASARLKYPKYKIAPSIQRLAVNRPQGVFPAYKRPFDGRFSLREMLLLPTVPIVEERTWSALSARF